MGKHTPGPWETPLDTWADYGDSETGHLYSVPVYEEGGERRIACAFHDGVLTEVQADARLIAAAPELLEVLETSLDTMRAIIDQKAILNVSHISDGGDLLRKVLHAEIERARTAIAKATGKEE